METRSQIVPRKVRIIFAKNLYKIETTFLKKKTCLVLGKKSN